MPGCVERQQVDKSERKIIKSTPKYAPGGQSTQLIVGASNESDYDVMKTSDYYYKNYKLKRVYYSGYVPISNDARLPVLGNPVPILRENRLYQTDWLMRFYGFQMQEILNEDHPFLDQQIDPKLQWALRNLDQFPVDINKASKHQILRVPGIGLKSVNKILSARRYRKLGWEHLRKIGIASNRAKYFITCVSKNADLKDRSPERLKAIILANSKSKFRQQNTGQLSLFEPVQPLLNA